MIPHDHIGIIAENSHRRISVFDADTLKVVQQFPVDADVIDVSVSQNCQRAVVSSFADKTFLQLDLGLKCVSIVGSAEADTFLEDVKVTPDGHFAISVDGSATGQAIVAYSLRDNAVVSSLPFYAQAVTASPTRRDMVLAAVESPASVHRFTIDRQGQLADTGQSVSVSGQPNNIIFSPDGRFAFVSLSGAIGVLSTQIPQQITLLDTIDIPSGYLQSMEVSADGRHLYALTSSVVSIYSFDAVAGSLQSERSFEHGLSITSFWGVDQIVLDATETRLFISGSGQLAVFTTYGLRLGNVEEAAGPGGLIICRRKRDGCSPCK